MRWATTFCYDGWDEATRKKFGLAIARYAEPSSSKRENITSNLGMLARFNLSWILAGEETGDGSLPDWL